MKCRGVRGRLSELLDAELDPVDAREVVAHLDGCPECGEHWESLRGLQAAMADLRPIECTESIASQVYERLALLSRSPGLALLARSPRLSRPLMLPSLAPAALVLVSVVCGILSLGPGPEPLPPVTARLQGQPWGRLAPSGTESNPLLPGIEVSTPVLQDRGMAELEQMGEGNIFVETVVARDGSVSSVTLLDGDTRQAQPFLDALRRETFEPGRYRGRPVAVSLYRLISHTEVRAPLT